MNENNFIELGFNIKIKPIEKRHPLSPETYKDFEIINNEVKQC